MALTVTRLTKHIAAEVSGIDLTQDIDAATAERLRALWLEHVVLLFRDQKLEQSHLCRLTEVFGTLAPLTRPKAFRPSGYNNLLEGIMLISNIRENGEAIGSLPDGEMMFHHDEIHNKMPHKGTLLYSVEVPLAGGNTLFANCYTAYEALPEAIREKLEGRKARHHYKYGTVQRGDANGQAVSAFSEAIHPIFRTHEETGRKAIYANRLMTEEVVDMPKGESEALLAALFDHSENPDWIYEHVWRTGDLIIWDNRNSMHARTDFPEGERRLLLRTTVAGERAPF
jgi:taurine dioxygenase